MFHMILKTRFITLVLGYPISLSKSLHYPNSLGDIRNRATGGLYHIILV